MTHQKFHYIPLELYLEHEQTALLKSEYLNGQVLAMGGNTLIHDNISNRLLASLLICLDEKGCWMGAKDILIYMKEKNKTRYPDVVIICGDEQATRLKRNAGAVAYTDATVIAEVLSPSTEWVDRIDKFEEYKTLPSFQVYILIHQEEPRVEIFEKDAQGNWPEHPVISDELFEVLGCKVQVRNLYKRPVGG